MTGALVAPAQIHEPLIESIIEVDDAVLRGPAGARDAARGLQLRALLEGLGARLGQGRRQGPGFEAGLGQLQGLRSAGDEASQLTVPEWIN